jgi:hypothetical protein
VGEMQLMRQYACPQRGAASSGVPPVELLRTVFKALVSRTGIDMTSGGGPAHRVQCPSEGRARRIAQETRHTPSGFGKAFFCSEHCLIHGAMPALTKTKW